jgi:hypothetical protein
VITVAEYVRLMSEPSPGGNSGGTDVPHRHRLDAIFPSPKSQQ